MSKFKPYAARHVIGGMIPLSLVIAETFMGKMVVKQQMHMPGFSLGVVCHAIADWDIAKAFVPAENTSLQSFVPKLKEAMVKYGASHEAVRLVGELSPFTQEELNSMADKLKSKTATAAAKTKPVGNGGKVAADKKAAPKGNAEALKKAREATDGKRAEARTRKITVVNKDHGARPGSKRATQLDIVIKAKTVQAALDAGAEMVDINFAAKEGFITLA